MTSESQIPDLPKATVTFLFTDIEGSTKLLNILGDQYGELLTEHRRILREVTTRRQGKEVDVQGDMCFFTFPRASDAITVAIEAQKTLTAHEWPDEVEVRVRMGLHTGEPLVAEGGYVGMDVHLASRIGDVGHGGQVLLSEATAALIHKELPAGVSLLDLGEHQLKDIPHPEQIHQLVIEGYPSEFPPLKSLQAELPPHNLRIQSTPFVGRKDELEDLEALISDPDNRLISIVGAGGMGKTRLAIASAEGQLEALISTNGQVERRFPDGAFFVHLAPVETIEGMIPAIAEATGFQIHGEVDSKKQILDFLRQKQLLLIMDNFEHLMGGVTLLNEMLQAAPEVRILVTSRERLNLSGEVLYPLDGMRYPDVDEISLDDEPFSAVELFLGCAKRIQPSFDPNDEEMKSVGRICRLVEGMPLGVELAASWIEVLSTSEITSEIQSSLDFLEAEVHDVPERHRSIRAVFDSTWKLLKEDEQEILMGLSVFRGGFTTEAAREVSGALLKQLQRLANKSLVQRSEDGRVHIHELLRQYASELLVETKDGGVSQHRKHAVYYSRLVHDQTQILKGGEQKSASDTIRAEMNNISKMWHWVIRNGYYDAIDLALEGIWTYFSSFSYPKPGERMLGAAVESLRSLRSSENDELYQRCLLRWGFLLAGLGEKEEARQLAEEAMDLARALRNEREVGLCFELYGDLSWPEHDEMKRYLKQAELAFRNSGDTWGIIRVLRNLFQVALEHEGIWASVVYAEQARILSRSIGDRLSEASSLHVLAWNAYWNLSQLEKAKELRLEALRLVEEFGEWATLGVLFGLQFDEYALGNHDLAVSVGLRGLRIAREIGDPRIIIVFLSNLCFTYSAFEEYPQAKKCGQEAYDLAMQIDNAYLGAQATSGLSGVADTMGNMEEASHWAQRTLDLWDSIDKTGIEYQPVALGSICLLAVISAQKGDFNHSREQLAFVLGTSATRRHFDNFTSGLVNYARVLICEGKVEWALELLSFVASHAPWYWIRKGALRHLEEQKPHISKKRFREAVRRGEERTMEETISQLSEELGFDRPDLD